MYINTQGSSRLVIVFSNFVIKLPRINIVRLIKIAKRDLEKGTFRIRIKKKVKNNNFLLSVLAIPFHILLSNRREYLFYLKRKDNQYLMPLRGYCFGHVIVQPVGQVVSQNLECWKRVYEKLVAIGVNDKDILNPENYSFFQNRLVMHDYANPETQAFIIENGFDFLKAPHKIQTE